MKKTDIAMIVLVAGVSVLVSYLIFNTLFGDPSEQKETVQTMEVISSDYTEPSKEIFNEKAINPTAQVIIGQDGEKLIQSGK